MSEETIRVKLEDDASGPATVAAAGLEKLLGKLRDLEDTEVSNNAAQALERLSEAARRGGGAAEEALDRLRAAAEDSASAAHAAVNAWRATGGAADGVGAVVAKLNEATAAARRLEQAELAAARAAARLADQAEAGSLADKMKAANQVPAHLRVGPAPMEKDWFQKGLAAESSKSGSALKAAANDALNLAANIAKSEAAAKKLSSVYDLVAKRAAAAAKAEKSAFDEQVKAANKLPDHLKVGPEKGAVSSFAAMTGLVGKLFGPRATAGLLSGASKLSEASEKLGPWMPFLEKGGSLLLGGGKLLAVGAVALAAAAAAVLIAAGAIAAKLLMAGAELAIKATSAREAFVDPLAKVLKDQAAANAVYGGAVKVAIELGLDKEQVLQKAKALVGVGFRGEEINVILRAQADIGEVIGDDKANGFLEKLKQIKSGKAFNMGVVEGLAETGVNVDLVLKKLAQQLGVSVDKVKEQLKAGKVDIAQGMKAILAAADEQFGGAAAKGAQSIPRLVQSLRTQLEGLFDQVDTTPLKEALGNLKKILDGPDGEKLKAAVNTLFGTVFKTIFAAFQGKEGEARLTRFVTGATKAMEGAAVILEKAGPSIINIIDGISKVLDRNGSTTGGSWLASLMMGLAQLATGPSFGQQIVQWLLGPLADIPGQLFLMGADMISGLVNGITSGAARVVDALVGAVSAAVAAAKAKLKSNSPSKVTEDLGGDTSEGFEIGIQRRLNRVRDAGSTMAGMVLAGAGGAANDNAIAGAVPAAAGGGGGSVTIVVQVQAGPGTTREQAQTAGEAAGEGAYRAWRRHLSRWARDEERKAS